MSDALTSDVAEEVAGEIADDSSPREEKTLLELAHEATRDNVQGRFEVTGEIGEKLQAKVDAFTAEMNQNIGASGALKVAATKVLSLAAHLASEMESGKLDEINDPALVVEKVKDYLRQASTLCVNLSGQAKAKATIAQGKAAGAQQSLDLVSNHHASAQTRFEQLTLPKPPPDPDADPGTKTRIRGRGKPTTAERRAARGKKATKKKAAKKTTKRTTKKATKKKAAKRTKKKAAKRTKKKATKKRGR